MHSLSTQALPCTAAGGDHSIASMRHPKPGEHLSVGPKAACGDGLIPLQLPRMAADPQAYANLHERPEQVRPVQGSSGCLEPDSYLVSTRPASCLTHSCGGGAVHLQQRLMAAVLQLWLRAKASDSCLPWACLGCASPQGCLQTTAASSLLDTAATACPMTTAATAACVPTAFIFLPTAVSDSLAASCFRPACYPACRGPM